MWPIWAILNDDLIWRRIAGAAGLMPTDGGAGQAQPGSA
jgi:hypothetical protein